MLEIAVCDDDIIFTGKVEKILEKIGQKYNVQMSIEVFWDGDELVESIKSGERFDIIYLDIEMKRMNGLDAANEIRKIDRESLLIYITSYESYMPVTFDYRPFQFIVKPIQIDKFEQCFVKAYQEILRNDSYFQFKYNKTYHRILSQNIMYFESSKRVISIITSDTIMKFYGKLDEVENALRGSKLNFLRIHQSYLVNFKYIEEIAYDRVKLIDGQVLYISEDRRKKIGRQYCDIAGSAYIWS